MIVLKRKRDLERPGVTTAFRLRGREVDEEKIVKYEKRAKIQEEDVVPDDGESQFLEPVKRSCPATLLNSISQHSNRPGMLYTTAERVASSDNA